MSGLRSASHHVAARASKCAISSDDTDDEEDCGRDGAVDADDGDDDDVTFVAVVEEKETCRRPNGTAVLICVPIQLVIKLSAGAVVVAAADPRNDSLCRWLTLTSWLDLIFYCQMHYGE